MDRYVKKEIRTDDMRKEETLDSVIEFLSNDSLWSLDVVTKCNDKKTPAQLAEDELVRKIKMELQGDDLTPYDVRLIRRHFELEQELSGEHRNVVAFLERLFVWYGIGNGVDSPKKYSKNKDNWLAAKEHLCKLVRFSCSYHDVEINGEIKIKAAAIAKLRKRGYEIPHVRGRFSPSESDTSRFANEIEERFRKLGRKATYLILNELNETCFNAITNRYNFHAAPTMVGNPELQTPWGYLLNVAFANFSKPCTLNPKGISQLYFEVKELSKLYFGVLELQVLTTFAAVYRPIEEWIDELVENVTYDQHFAIEQIPCEEMLELLNGIVNHSSDSMRSAIYLSIMEWVCKSKIKLNSLNFDRQEICKALRNRFSSQEVDEALSELSTDACDLNCGYLDPMDVTKRNYFKKPFVRNGGDYILLSKYYFAKGFYLSWLENRCADKAKVGGVFEDVLVDLFNDHQVEFIHSAEYVIPMNVRRELSCTSEKEECDFIIQSDDSVYFIELKKKEITAKAMSGAAVDALIDMSRSALHGLTQAFTHEYCIRRWGKLDLVLKDGTQQTVTLGNRKVIKIHVSLFDHYGLHDGVFLQHFLRSVLHCEFSTGNSDDLQAFIKQQKKFRDVANTELMRGVYKRGFLLTFASFSLLHFLRVLKRTSSTEQFCKEIAMTLTATSSTRDWYQEDAFLNIINS